MHIDHVQMKLVVSYPPEPILGGAACQLLHRVEDSALASNQSNLVAYIGHFLSSCFKGLVSAGSYSALMARIMLPLAYDRIQLGTVGIATARLFSEPTGLQSFLNTFFGNYTARYRARFIVDVLKIPHQLTAGIVCFMSWVSLERLPQNSDVIEFIEICYKRHCAVILPPNNPGANLLIPIQYQTPDGTKILYSYILIQAQDRVQSKSFYLALAGECLSPHNAFGNSNQQSIPYLALFMEIVPEALESLTKAGTNKFQSFSNDFPNHGLLLGFYYTFISYEANLAAMFRSV